MSTQDTNEAVTLDHLGAVLDALARDAAGNPAVAAVSFAYDARRGRYVAMVASDGTASAEGASPQAALQAALDAMVEQATRERGE